MKIVIDHFGNSTPALWADSPCFQAALRVPQDGRRGWVNLSAPYRSSGCDHRALARRLLAEAGLRRLLSDSDWPFVGHEAYIAFRQTIDWFETFISDTYARAPDRHTDARLYRLA